MNKLVIATLLVIGSVAVAATAVNAEVLGEQEQKQEAHQEAEAKCTGSYGQEITCSTKTTQSVKQEQSQKILGASDVIGRGGKVHVPANTAVDTRTMMVAAGMTLVGGASYAIKKKLA